MEMATVENGSRFSKNGVHRGHLMPPKAQNGCICDEYIEGDEVGNVAGENVGGVGAGNLAGLGVGAGNLGGLGVGGFGARDGNGGGANVGGLGAGAREPINLDDTTSSSGDGYENAEDEAYKPQPTDYDESESDSEALSSRREESGGKEKKVVESKKRISPRKIVYQRKGKCEKEEKVGEMSKKKTCKKKGGRSWVNQGAGPSGVHQ
ncbi:hypothetical protein PIB30_036199 [Stylosanthes scabra]|uniref:Uncharacterized protein n=1 Tax=Stylosanthes scabra TaxID=79078 RepID=A0ABU6SD73_9FABA|nr:hypothetical protein [Stylosanthes scabra]